MLLKLITPRALISFHRLWSSNRYLLKANFFSYFCTKFTKQYVNSIKSIFTIWKEGSF